MKTKNVLAAIVFMLAIGSAFASEYLLAVNAYSKKSDGVPNQVGDCELRGTCPNVTGPVCQITFDDDANPVTPPITANMYNSTCLVQLLRD